MIKKLLFILLFICYASSNLAQTSLFSQDFETSNNVEDYQSEIKRTNKFDYISPSSGNLTTSIENNVLILNRVNPSPATVSTAIDVYKNLNNNETSQFIKLAFDFEINGEHALNKGSGAINIQLGNSFGIRKGNITTRIGINTTSNLGEYKVSTIDNIGGVPQSNAVQGNNRISIFVNNTGKSQEYIGIDGTTQVIENNKMEFWVGNKKIVNNFGLRDQNVNIDGFKIASAGSVNLYGILKFDNFELLDLLQTPCAFEQSFNSSQALIDYTNGETSIGNFSTLSTSSGNLTTSIYEQQLRFDRENPSPSNSSTPVQVIGGSTKATISKLLEFSFDFAISGDHALNKGSGAINIQLGTFTSNSNAITTRIGINTTGTLGEYNVNTIDNRNGVPSSKNYNEKQNIKMITNQTGGTQNYLAPNGLIKEINNNKMAFWVGNDIIAENFELRDANTTISGFKIASAGSVNLYGVLDFDNIKLKELSHLNAIPENDLAPTSNAQLNFNHPFIWNSYADRDKIIENINNHVWAYNLFSQLKLRVDNKVNEHKIHPETILNSIPPIPGERTDRNPHTEILGSMTEAAILFYLTNENDYAQYAADILNHYMQRIYNQPVTPYHENSDGIIFNDGWLESRALFPRIALTYDFLYNFLKSNETTVFSLTNNSSATFDNQIAQTTVTNLADIVFISNQAPFSNHSVLSGNGLLYNLLMIEDDTKREQYFERLYSSYNETHDPYIWTLNNFTTNGIWPETYSYSSASQALVIQSMNIIDQYKPNLNLIENYKNILDGFEAYYNMFYPSDEIMKFGDSGQPSLIQGFQWLYRLALRKNLTNTAEFAKQNLQYLYSKLGTYKPTIVTDFLQFDSPLQLLWGENIHENEPITPPNQAQSFYVEHAKIAIQRNYNTSDVENNGLMYYTGGSNYVHAHSSGIDLELYGKGQLFGAESGSSTFGTDLHQEYRVRRAGHNSVIANSSGKPLPARGSWEIKNAVTELLAIEPKPENNPIAKNFLFSAQFMDDTYNDSHIQRTNSIIRTSPTTGYYFDNLRSLGKTTNNTHDYIYHNIGDEVYLKFTDDTLVPLNPSSLYETETEGNLTGYTYFEQVKSSELTDRAIDINFNINTTGKYMLVKIPEGINREYTSALSPNTQNAINGYDRKKTPVITIRKYGEAWDKSFVAVFEPSDSPTGTIKSTSHLYNANQKVVGVTVVSEVDGKTITDHILSNDNNQETINLTNLEINFSGRFGIVRIEDDGVSVNTELYIGEGQQLAYQDKMIFADNEGKAYQTFEDAPTLSVNEVNNSQLSFNAYPNPTQDALEIKLPNAIENNIAIEIYDLNAKLISTNNYNISNGKVTVNTSGYSSGVYFVKLNLDKPIYLKFIKE